LETDIFQINATGEIVRGQQNIGAFLPAPLPPNWQFPNRLWPALNEASKQVYLLEGIGRSLPEPGLLLRPIQDREAIQSSRIEGTYATARELLLFELAPREPKPGERKVGDWQEVFNYRRALDHGTASALPLSLRLIQQMHEILMDGVRGKDKTPGEFRRIQVAIGENHRFVPPPPDRLPKCLDQFEKYMNNIGSEYDPLVHCFLAHYQFETVHPFSDGNGRVGRLLLAVMLQRLCGLTKAWLYLSDFFEKNRKEYIQRLFEVSTRAAWDEWVEFCIRGTIEQAKETVDRCHRLVTLRETYRQRLANVGGDVRLNQIVENLFQHPFIRVTDVQRRLQITYPTAKADIDRLVRARILKQMKGETPKTFFAPELFDVAYADISDEE
jgi:Fic family protein